MATTLRCKLDGKQSVTFPVTLKKNGRFLTDPVKIIVRGFLKFDEDDANRDEVSIYESGEYQRNSANLLEDKTIVYPVLFTSDEITINNGKGTITLLPRSEDILSDYNTISGRVNAGDAVVSETEILEEGDTQILIEVGKERVPYKVSIQVTLVDENESYFGQTIDRISVDDQEGQGLFRQDTKQLTGNLIIEFYSDLEWIPSIKSMLGSNAGTSQEALDAIENLANEVPFGSSAMYDALTASAETLSDNEVDPFRKVIYLLTDNDSNMSVSTADETIDDINAIDGFRKVPILTGNLQVTKPITLSVKANTTDTVNLNKLGFLTGGQSVTVVDESFIDEIVDIFYGEAVGAMGYGRYEFTVDLQSIVAIERITGGFLAEDLRSSASWQIELSNDNYTYTAVDEIFSVTSVYQEEDSYARYIKFKVTLITGFSTDEYLGGPESPILNNFEIIYNKSKVVFLFLNNADDGNSPHQMVIAVDGNSITPGQIEVGLSKSDSSNWVDYSNGSQPTVDQNGKISIPIRFSQDTSEFPQEPLRKLDYFTLQTLYGSWDPYSTIAVYDKGGQVISARDYKPYPRNGLVVFNTILPDNYVDGDYSIGILNGSDYKLGFKLTNISNEDNLEIYGLGKMYSTGKDLLPPVEKLPPEAQEVKVSPEVPNVFSVISLSYVYFDSNFDDEDISQREIKWYINGVNVSYLDGLTSWNDLSDINDPIYQNALSFTASDLNDGETAEQRARSLGESIIKVGDTIYATVKVSDGELLSELKKADTVNVIEGIPTVSEILIRGLDVNGAIVDRISSDNTAFVTFNLNADTTGNQSEIIWFVGGFEFKRGVYGSPVAPDKVPADRLLPGEVSLNTGDWALKIANEIWVQIIPSTGTSIGLATTSGTKIVENAYPVISNALILPTVVTQFSDMTLTWDFSDFDIDVLQTESQVDTSRVDWYLKTTAGGSVQTTDFEKVDAALIDTDIPNHVSVVRSAILSEGQQWFARITPNDSVDDGTVVQTQTKTITSG